MQTSRYTIIALARKLGRKFPMIVKHAKCFLRRINKQASWTNLRTARPILC